MGHRVKVTEKKAKQYKQEKSKKGKSPKRLVWTEKLPACVGYYWVRIGHFLPRIVLLTKHPGTRSMYVFTVSGSNNKLSDYKNHEWAGPILEPEEE